ncbi:hypothetical protein QE152_g34835 [Popillia japonica]|uniref:Uncharacterized protein n=1 Tax=Popillia japonica TaxID=7064 RepID=A0AAW1ITD6_POPJA
MCKGLEHQPPPMQFSKSSGRSAEVGRTEDGVFEGTVQFCGRTLIAEVTKICRNRNSRGLDGERPLIVNLRSLLHNLFSRDTITNECYIAKVEAKKALNEMKILELSVEIITQAIFPNSFLQLSNYRQYHAGSPMRKALANLVITRKV